jgi:hypothetical protein
MWVFQLKSYYMVTLFYTEIQFGSRMHMLPLLKKHISKVKKKLTKIFACTCSQSKRVCKVLPKTDMFCGLCKKTKIVMWNALFLAPNFIFLHMPHDTSICRRTNFLFQFFDILKYIKYVFQNIGSICSQEPSFTYPTNWIAFHPWKLHLW